MPKPEMRRAGSAGGPAELAWNWAFKGLLDLQHALRRALLRAIIGGRPPDDNDMPARCQRQKAFACRRERHLLRRRCGACRRACVFCCTSPSESSGSCRSQGLKVGISACRNHQVQSSARRNAKSPPQFGAAESAKRELGPPVPGRERPPSRSRRPVPKEGVPRIPDKT